MRRRWQPLCVWDRCAKARWGDLRDRNDDKVLRSVVVQHWHIRLLVLHRHEGRDLVFVRGVLLFSRDKVHRGYSMGHHRAHSSGQERNTKFPFRFRLGPADGEQVKRSIIVEAFVFFCLRSDMAFIPSVYIARATSYHGKKTRCLRSEAFGSAETEHRHLRGTAHRELSRRADSYAG